MTTTTLVAYGPTGDLKTALIDTEHVYVSAGRKDNKSDGIGLWHKFKREDITEYYVKPEAVYVAELTSRDEEILTAMREVRL